jgi:mRNA interferase MazF
MRTPDRGEVWLVDLGYVGKTRPCLVVSVPPLAQDRALTTIVPHTTSVRATRFEVSVGARFLHTGAFDAQDILTVSNAKFLRVLGRLSPTDFAAVEQAIRNWLAF